ncbi:hypothetical protein HPB50_005685 [Hyalomma asiaticum]|uniref:Uncharacterized protein n=1 Tax=Hyalomma asiaticum TaxID=266040 RepID=A0ACB7RY67_HYAAI|nr:hypothetical protein HPB50_005685 [Hyalomma asiaticum]
MRITDTTRRHTLKHQQSRPHIWRSNLRPGRNVRRRRAPGDCPGGGRPLDLRSDGSLRLLPAPILRGPPGREESVAFPLVHTFDDRMRRVRLDTHALIAARADHAGRASVFEKHARRDSRGGGGGRGAEQNHARNTHPSSTFDDCAHVTAGIRASTSTRRHTIGCKGLQHTTTHASLPRHTKGDDAATSASSRRHCRRYNYDVRTGRQVFSACRGPSALAPADAAGVASVRRCSGRQATRSAARRKPAWSGHFFFGGALSPPGVA